MRGGWQALGVVLALCSTGCAMVFMDRLPENYDVRASEPHCSTNMGFVVWDGAIALLDLASLPLLVGSDSELSQTNETLLLAAVVGESLLHTFSAVVGTGWANECAAARQQRAAYSRAVPFRVPERKTLRQRRRAAATQRGFYCAAQSCAKERDACEYFRIATGDPTACTLMESAFCFAIHDLGVCAPTIEACQRQRAAAGSAAESECIAQGEAGSTRPPALSPGPLPEPQAAGFHCAADVCARTLEVCERERASAQEVSECTPAASAHCFTLRGAPACRSSLEACQRQFAAAGDAASSECVLSR